MNAATVTPNSRFLEPAFNPAADKMDSFMAGKELVAAMREKAEHIDAAGSDEADYEAQYRAGAPQNVFALPMIEALLQRPELKYGFAAALSSAFMHGDSADTIRSWTYLDNIHGPHTDYTGMQKPPGWGGRGNDGEQQ